MAECTTECQEINPDQSRCEVIQKHPSHLGDEENEQGVKEGISQKCGRYLPNGKIRLAVDDNGLVTHSARTVEHETDALPVDNISSNCQCDRSHDSMEATGHRSKKNKSLDSQLSELASEFDSLDLDTDSKEPVVEKPDQELEKDVLNGIEYVVYKSEVQMPDIMRLITKDLSEPYSIYTYRYFIHNWPKLCFLAMDGEKCVGAIVCKLDMHKKMVRRGYIAMLAIDSEYRRKKIGSHLVLKAIKAMIADDCDEVVLETEITNQPALRLYENLGFVRDKRLFRYYLNGVDALRLKLWLR